MIIVDKPFVSDFLKTTIEENGFPVIRTEVAGELGFSQGPNILEEAHAIEQAQSAGGSLIYTTSENSIGWISEHLATTGLPQKIDLFKNKIKFRRLIATMYPQFYFKEVLLEQLDELDVETIPMPFIIKPAIGFFSIGVYKVSTQKEWPEIKKSLADELLTAQGLYPSEVLNTTAFIIEQCIEGEEFAVDAYFSASGEPVILNIYQHIFSSSEDVGDRVYITSKNIIVDHIDQFSEFLAAIGKLADVKNFPVHIEIRRQPDGTMLPIEINPMRFGGWCTTADMTYFAYGFNPYVTFFSQTRPDWSEILKDREGKLFAIVVLDNSTGIEGNQIASFDYDALVSNFEKPLELRKIDFEEYPVFGFLFTETKADNFSELERILKSDLNEFITLK